ncbi:hypothetical protein [Rhodoblastus sp.]|jgi:hypothetical protein|uniref:hypothetical protein n=1 Tax=Rhodoblastus sp. TaxID=1962975 RepID=UPI00262B89A1|nr:hypothetical protein [Rhodoblastus sp.]
MCDYSLEMYESRPAREGEVYVTTQFPSGSIGLTAPESAATAICLACGSRLLLENLALETQKTLGVKETEEATFIYCDEGLYHDGIAFDNGVRATLCRLGPGVMVSLKDLPGPARKPEPKEMEAEIDKALEPAE